ncbi:siderophore-interacting protein [Motilimonas cestriensis]|uniref:Siderophore-interacting protein n=1 Tax=Motilimonas cestriensis TaxID=2742685 RepID=A0ABS8WFS1_9GAMM|nr:siderophore-interacting protein [Motilimonas cestriensis]MCE2597012.1 siderophore-interacting protein [Motilimonas cestriensis]
MPQQPSTKIRQPILVTVKSVRDISPHLRRICFTGPALASYPFQCNGAHIKIMLPQPHQLEPILPTMTSKGPRWESDKDKPILRTFSIRAFREAEQEIEIDFALHGDLGPATRFATHVKIGDVLGISPPGGPEPMLKPARYYYMAGDLTALPAISAMIADMPSTSQGYIALLVPSKTDIDDLAVPTGVTVRWFVGQPAQSDRLIQSFIEQTLQSEDSYFWFGGEETIVVGLRRHVRRHLDIERTQVYAIPYWRNGQSEDAYHQRRHDVLEN